MRKSMPVVFLGLVVFAGPAMAQEYPPDQVAFVKSVYRQYLHRDADPQGLVHWLDQIQNGMSPNQLRSTILASDEYFERAGGTDRRYISALFRDLSGHEPSRRELNTWLGRLSGTTHQQIATDLLMRLRRR